MLYLDQADQFDEFGRWSADLFAVAIDGLGDENERYATAVAFVEALLKEVRIQTGQWWAGRSINTGAPTFALQVPKVASNAFDGSTAAVSNGLFVQGSIRPMDADLWLQCIKGVDTPKGDRRNKSVLSDVAYYRALGETSACLLVASGAIEAWRDDIFAVTRRDPQGSDLMRHLSRDLDRILGRNLERENHSLFEFLRATWSARGRVAHGRDFLWLPDRTLRGPPDFFHERLAELLHWLQSVHDLGPSTQF